MEKPETNKHISSARLIGILDPRLEQPGFVTPVFSDPSGLFYIATSSEFGVTIQDFIRVDVDSDLLTRPPEEFSRTFVVGEARVFSFRGVAGDIETGTRKSLVKGLREEFRRLSKYPLCQLEVASFINEPRLVATAIRKSITFEITKPCESPGEALTQLSLEFKVEREMLTAYLAMDYAQALISYYRLFHRLIHVQDLRTRSRLQFRFRAATENIIPFLLNGSVFEALPPPDFWRDRQLNLPSVIRRQVPRGYQIATVLRNLGVSASSAETYALRAITQDHPRHEPPTASEIKKAASSLRTLSFRRKYLDFATGRLDKKRKKRELDQEFMDLIYGLSLILGHELRILSLDAEIYSSVRRSLSRSVRRIGSENPAPPN